MISLRYYAIRIHWLLSTQLGFNPRLLIQSLCELPSFIRDCRRYRKGFSGEFILSPCLHDRHEESGDTKNEYFWQDLLVARWIHAARPRKHVDVGSRVDGFVAHLASFRDIEVFDVRPSSAQIPGVIFHKADLAGPGGSQFEPEDYCDSLSCLHAIEHFGLGRYNDHIDPLGHERGIANMARMLKTGGTLYLSAPIGRERVEFNANRIFDPRTIIRIADTYRLKLAGLTVIRVGGHVTHVSTAPSVLQELAQERYSLGIFIFTK